MSVALYVHRQIAVGSDAVFERETTNPQVKELSHSIGLRVFGHFVSSVSKGRRSPSVTGITGSCLKDKRPAEKRSSRLPLGT